MFADRAERIAYNALPATFASPRGGDMWNHQYLQALNEVNAMVNDTHVWTHDGGDAEVSHKSDRIHAVLAFFFALA